LEFEFVAFFTFTAVLVELVAVGCDFFGLGGGIGALICLFVSDEINLAFVRLLLLLLSRDGGPTGLRAAIVVGVSVAGTPEA
jgi:hypothetical protein